MITGKKHTIFQTFNTTAPLDDTPLVVPVKYILAADVELPEDFFQGQSDQIVPAFQSMFIDNGANGFPLWIYNPMTDYTLKVASNMQGIFPIYSPLPYAPRLTMKGGGGTVTILWCNFVQPYSAWTAV